MTRLIIAALVALLVAVSWPKSAEAKTTYYQCDDTTYKLDEPWFGSAKFYQMRRGNLEFLRSTVDSDFIHWWPDDEWKKKNPDTVWGFINRISGDTSWSTYYKKVTCHVLDGPP